MKGRKLNFDRSCHVLYLKQREKEIRDKTSHHYSSDECDAIWERIQKQYVDYLAKCRTDLGGKKNYHNGKGGTYDCIAIMCYFSVCRDVATFREIEEIEENLVLPSFRFLSKFVDCNKPIWQKLMYKAFAKAKKGCDAWHDYEMHVAPYEKNKPIYYEFTACPVAEFAKEFNLTEIMPALCNVDYVSMELIHARLVRSEMCSNGCKCDYTICGDLDTYIKEHPEYRDEHGYRRKNKSDKK